MPARRVTALDAVLNRCPVNNAWLYYRRFGADMRIDFPETRYSLKLIVLRGQGKLTVGSATVDLAEGATAIVSANTGWSLRCTAWNARKRPSPRSIPTG